jgi:hypothetical protein
MSRDLPAWATWTDVVVALHHTEVEIFDFIYPAENYFVDAVTYSSVGFLLDLTYLQSTRVLLWRLSACFLAGHLVLVAWLGGRLKLPPRPPPVSLV